MNGTKQTLRSLYLLYHELRPDPSDYSYVVQNEQFLKHLQLFTNLRSASKPTLHPEITFDDGHISNFNYALPMLSSHEVKAHFFITVGWTGTKSGYMGWNELRALHNAGQMIGAHGWSHALLTHCSEQDLHAELNNSRLTLEDKLGTSITTMSLPGGRYDRRVLAACQKAGYTQVFTSIPRSEPIPPGPLVGRLNIRSSMQLQWLSDLFEPRSAILAALGRQYQMKSVAKKLLGDRLYEKTWALLNRKGPEMETGETSTNEDTAHHQ